MQKNAPARESGLLKPLVYILVALVSMYLTVLLFGKMVAIAQHLPPDESASDTAVGLLWTPVAAIVGLVAGPLLLWTLLRLRHRTNTE